MKRPNCGSDWGYGPRGDQLCPKEGRMNAFTIRAVRDRGCDRCGAQPGWPCIPEGRRQLAVGVHADRLIAQSAADLEAKNKASE